MEAVYPRLVLKTMKAVHWRLVLKSMEAVHWMLVLKSIEAIHPRLVLKSMEAVHLRLVLKSMEAPCLISSQWPVKCTILIYWLLVGWCVSSNTVTDMIYICEMAVIAKLSLGCPIMGWLACVSHHIYSLTNNYGPDNIVYQYWFGICPLIWWLRS